VCKLQFDAKDGFSCSKCGESPNCVLFDGTFLACKKDWLVGNDTSDGSEIQTGSAHQDRILLPNRDQQRQVLEFSKTTQKKPWNQHQFQQLLDSIQMKTLKKILVSIVIKNAEIRPILIGTKKRVENNLIINIRITPVIVMPDGPSF